MDSLKLLLVEDNPDDRDTFRSSVRVYETRNKALKIEMVEVANLEEAERSLNNSFDAAVVDLKLGSNEDAGEQLISDIRSKWRIPVAVLTGTPMHLDDRSGLVGVYLKGEKDNGEILDKLKHVWDTGLTKVFGGRGVIEMEMAKIFWKSVLPNLEAWQKYVLEGKPTESAILRFTLNHLMDSLQTEAAHHFAEETYINPVLDAAVIQSSKQLRTGSIVRETSGGESAFFVITPACDLVVRSNSLKTERILLCEIDAIETNYVVASTRKLFGKEASEPSEAETLATKQANGIAAVRKICSNTAGSNLHFLPPTTAFPGGIVNFRKLISLKPSEFDKAFGLPVLQVSPFFTKDVVSRFSSYYARQGQPDLYFDELASKLAGEKKQQSS